MSTFYLNCSMGSRNDYIIVCSNSRLLRLFRLYLIYENWRLYRGI